MNSGASTSFDQGDEEQVGDRLAEEERRGRRGRHPLRVEHAIALLAGPGLVERGDRGEEERHPENSAGDLAGHGGGGIERQREDHDDQQREKQHPVDGVAGAPLELEVLAQMGENVAEDSSCVYLALARRVGFGEVGEDGAGGAQVVGRGE